MLECDSVEDGKRQVEKIMEMVGLKSFTVTHIKEPRTDSQNRACHKWFDMIASDAQDKGLTMDALIREPAEFPITPSIIKDFFREIGRLMFKKDSTAKLKKEEFSQVIDVCEREFAKRLDCQIPFPSIESQMDNYYQEQNEKNIN